MKANNAACLFFEEETSCMWSFFKMSFLGSFCIFLFPLYRVYQNALVLQCHLSECPCSNVTKTNSCIYCTASDWQALTERFVWAGLTLFQRLCSSSLWKWANSLRSWMLVSSFHSSNKDTPSTTTEADSTAVIRITFGPDGHSWQTGSHSSLLETHCYNHSKKCISCEMNTHLNLMVHVQRASGDFMEKSGLKST